MISARFLRFLLQPYLASYMILAASVLCAGRAQAQPTIVSTVPAMGASGVSPSADVVFTFSEPMDTNATEAQFLDISNPLNPFPTTQSWNAGATVLTCTPTPAFPSNKQIYWVVSGQNPGGDSLGGTPGGFFTTGTGGGGGSTGSGTNRVTTFTLGKIYLYDQTSAGAPTSDTNVPYAFEAVTVLASNRTATAITLTLPNNGGTSNLTQNFVEHEDYYLFYDTQSSNVLETTFPAGSYAFNVMAAASNQTVSVALAPASNQPNAPHASNYAEAQSVNASQPFTLKWDAFSGGTSGDYISVSVDGGTEVWKTGDFGTTNALPGTATSVTIPAGILTSNNSYTVNIGFYRATWSSNVTYAIGSFRASTTQLGLTTVGTSAPLPVVSAAGWTAGSFGFDVTTSPGQQLTVVSSTDVSLPLNAWPTLLTTNSPGTKVHISTPAVGAEPARFYAVRNGP